MADSSNLLKEIEDYWGASTISNPDGTFTHTFTFNTWRKYRLGRESAPGVAPVGIFKNQEEYHAEIDSLLAKKT